MKEISFTIKPNYKKKMSKEELARYIDETKKSCHVFRNKKKYDRKRLKKVDF